MEHGVALLAVSISHTSEEWKVKSGSKALFWIDSIESFPIKPLWKIFSITCDSPKNEQERRGRKATGFAKPTPDYFTVHAGWKARWSMGCEAYMKRKTKKDTRERKETLIIKIYVHALVVTCFFNFFCASTSFLLLMCPLKFLSWFPPWKNRKLASFVRFSLSNMKLTLPSHSGKASHLTSSPLPFSHSSSFSPSLLPVHYHANNLLFAGHLWNCHPLGAFNVREPHPAHDTPHNDSLNYDVRVSAGNRHASFDTRERKYQMPLGPLMDAFLNIISH